GWVTSVRACLELGPGRRIGELRGEVPRSVKAQRRTSTMYAPNSTMDFCFVTAACYGFRPSAEVVPRPGRPGNPRNDPRKGMWDGGPVPRNVAEEHQELHQRLRRGGVRRRPGGGP